MCVCVCVFVCVCVCAHVCVCARVCVLRSMCVCVYLIGHLAVLSVLGMSLVEKQLTLHQSAQSSHGKVSFKLFREQICV